MKLRLQELLAATRINIFEPLCAVPKQLVQESDRASSFCHLHEFPANKHFQKRVSISQQKPISYFSNQQYTNYLRSSGLQESNRKNLTETYLILQILHGSYESVLGILLKPDIKCHKNNITQSLRDKHCLFICNSKSLNCIYFQHEYLECNLTVASIRTHHIPCSTAGGAYPVGC